MEHLTPLITPIVESLMGVVKKHLSFCFCSTNNVRDMHARIKKLNNAARDMKEKKERNDANNRVVPHQVPSWLAQVEEICEEAGNVPTGGIGCFNMKTKYKVGKQSSDILRKIADLETQNSDITWSDEQRPLGRVLSTLPSTSEPVVVAAANDDDGTQTGLKSRDLIFKEAMKSLDPNNKIQKIALCGMGGVGKTTMMDQLKKAVEGNKLFDWVIKVDIGKNPNPITLQQTVAEYLGEPLQEKVKDTRAKSLLARFAGISQNGKKNILVILDDLWEEVDLKDIGLTDPLPKGFKLLLTSREENVCTRMGVEASSIFRVDVLDEGEAKFLFWDIRGKVSDGNLRKIGEDIVTECHGLPIAIKTIASDLRDNSVKDEWSDYLTRLRNQPFPLHETIFKTSYENLKDDDVKATFLLSGLFPDDYNIPIEDLMRYGWGLKLFKTSETSTARCRANTCVNKLVRSNLLIQSDLKGCVKMHDLVRDFVLSNFSIVKQASLVNSDDISEKLTEESYERILLRCKGMREFPADFNHPNLALLKLLDGDNLDTFPEDFYDRMEKLEVVAYDRIRQPLLPRCYSTLRTLCLRSCKLVDDISLIGDLINLEVLSFAFCGISKLPSAIGNLKNLKLLDLSECVNLCIDDGVFHKLKKLRELYMRAREGNPIRFTEDSWVGLKMLSSKLIALDVALDVQPKNSSFEKLERFRISMGRDLRFHINSIYAYENMLRRNSVYAYENTLRLAISCKELLECKINELFEKTEHLTLRVNRINSLEQILTCRSQHSFCNLISLYVAECAHLTRIFTVNVANSLTELEILKVSRCPVLESLVQGENGEAKVIKFHKLKILELVSLPMFVSLCDADQVMELPQLVELKLFLLPNITSIFSDDNEISATTQPLMNKKPLSLFHNLTTIDFEGCKSIKYLFSPLMATHLSNLKKVRVRYCDGMEEVVSNRDYNEDEQMTPPTTTTLFPHLRQLLKKVRIRCCDGMEEVVSNRDDNKDEQMTPPTTTTLFPHLQQLFLESLPSLKHVGDGVAKGTNNDINDQLKYSQVPVVCWPLCQYSRNITVRNCPDMSHVIPSYVAGQLLMVEHLYIRDCIVMKEVFASRDINNSGGVSSNSEETSGGTDTALAIPRTSITAHNLSNLKAMFIRKCDSLEHIFTFSTLESLSKLESIDIIKCKAMKVIVREENGEQTVASKAVVFPCLKSIKLYDLPNLEGFFLGKDLDISLPSLNTLEIKGCPKLETFTKGRVATPELKVIRTNLGLTDVGEQDINSFTRELGA